MAQNQDSQTDPKKTRRASGLRAALLVAFLIAALLTAILTFRVVRDLVLSWEITSLPGVSIKDATPTPGPEGAAPADLTAPLQPVGGPTPPPWDGADRVSLLVMGLDYRDWAAGEGPPRTDTMILLTIDPINRTAGMLSIPRDLWVNIPGSGHGRINTAYQIGEALAMPGGGPELAKETVEELLGVPIDYYAQVDFGAFARFIDQIGGVTIDIPEEIRIDTQGDENTGKKIRKLKPGRQTLNGELTLAYARARKTEGGDFDRSMRQQLVIMAIRNRLVEPDHLAGLIARAPVLYNELSAGIRTNLSMDQAIRLAWLAAQIPEDKIKRGAIGAEHVAFAQSPDGSQDVLKPLSEKIRLLRDEIFTETGPASPLTISLDPAEQVSGEGARVRVLNGSSTAGLAARTTDYLKSLGVNVTEAGNAEQLANYTEITYHSGKPYTVKFLVDLMQISPFRIRHFYDPNNSADIVIVLGEDWAQNNPMP
jgi:LCP family protein required for cell wall assembly